MNCKVREAEKANGIESTTGWFQTVPGKFLGIVGQDLSGSKSNRLHVDIIFRFWFIHLKYIL